MKIGIYLAYRPFRKGFSLKQEGLGRYVASLVKNLCESGNQVTIACPKWFVDVLTDLFEDYKVDINSLELVTPKREPLILRLFYKKGQKKRNHAWKWRIEKYSFRAFEVVIDIFLSIKNWLFLFGGLLVFILVFSILLPFLLLFFLLYSIYKLTNKMFSLFGENSVSKFVSHFVPQKFVNFIKNTVMTLLNGDYLAERVRQIAARELKYYIEHMKNPADIWYSPTAFWPEFNELNVLTVTCIPDLVSEEFALNFSRSKDIEYSIKRISDSIENGQYFITYCDYVKESLLVNKFGIHPQRIKSILMFVNDMVPEINVKDSFKFHPNANHIFARELLTRLSIYNVNALNPLYFCSDVFFAFDDIKYIFYSSQVRHSKNILNLVKAYNYLLREEKTTCKLFLTGNYEHLPELKEYIHKHNLQNDVLCFWNVPNQILAALYTCAELSVNPTLYEGGFPFTFSEGMSVGTPSVMSRIPQVEEFVFGWNLEDCLFDPYNFTDIADKILYGLNNRDLLIQKQYPLFKQHYDRTKSGQAGKEYVEAFEYFMNLDKATK